MNCWCLRAALADRSTASSGQRRVARRRWAARTAAQPNKLPASDVHQTGQAAEGAAADGILGRQVRLRHPAKNCEAGVSKKVPKRRWNPQKHQPSPNTKRPPIHMEAYNTSVETRIQFEVLTFSSNRLSSAAAHQHCSVPFWIFFWLRTGRSMQAR